MGKTDEVVFVDPSKRSTFAIVINKNQCKRHQTESLLHECGHILVFLQRRRHRFKRIAGYTFYQWLATKPVIRSVKGRAYSLFEEEITAWNRGWFLAKRLNLDVNQKSYVRHMYRCLKTYAVDL